MRILTFALVASLELVLFARGGLAQHGVAPEWSEEVALPLANPEASQRGVLYNNMAVSSGGRVFIATEEEDPDTHNTLGYYLTYSDDGLLWQTPIPIAPMSEVIGGASPKLEMDADDNLYVLFSSHLPGALFIARYDTSLTLLSDTVRVASYTLYNRFKSTHLTIDRENRLHVMWHEGDGNFGETMEVFYTRSTDGGQTWSPPLPLSDQDGHHSAFPRGRFDAAGDTLAIVWRDSVSTLNQWDVLMALSTDGGAHWSPPVPMIETPHTDSDPDVVIDDRNNFHLFFHRYPVFSPFSAGVHYAVSTDLGATWTERPLSDPLYRSHLTEGNLYDPVRNTLWCMWKDERDFDFGSGQARADVVLSYSTDRGLTWSAPEFATDHDTLTIGFKAGILLPDGSYAINYESTQPTSSGLRVYYRKRSPVVRTDTDPASAPPPDDLSLNQNYPNPFNHSTRITFSIPVSMHVNLSIFDVLGRIVATVVDRPFTGGTHIFDFSAAHLPSGVYVYRLQAGRLVQYRMMEVVK